MFTSMYRYDLVAFIYILCSFTLRLSKAWHDPDLKYRILSELSFDTCHCWNRQLHYLIVPYEGFHKWRHPKMDAFVMENPNKKGSVPGNLHMFYVIFPRFLICFVIFPFSGGPAAAIAKPLAQLRQSSQPFIDPKLDGAKHSCRGQSFTAKHL